MLLHTPGGIILAAVDWGDPLSINPLQAVIKGPFNKDTVAKVEGLGFTFRV